VSRLYSVEWPCQNCGAMTTGRGSCKKCLAFDPPGADQFNRLAKLGVQTMAALVRLTERGQAEELVLKSIIDAAREQGLLKPAPQECEKRAFRGARP
jgi:hypothetical protein